MESESESESEDDNLEDSEGELELGGPGLKCRMEEWADDGLMDWRRLRSFAVRTLLFPSLTLRDLYLGTVASFEVSPGITLGALGGLGKPAHSNLRCEYMSSIPAAPHQSR